MVIPQRGERGGGDELLLLARYSLEVGHAEPKVQRVLEGLRSGMGSAMIERYGVRVLEHEMPSLQQTKGPVVLALVSTMEERRRMNPTS